MENMLCKRPGTSKADYMMMINEKFEMDWRDDESM
jgi:hypothetical protein